MAVRAVVGLQWGDEGKGKIVDVLGESAEIVVRCQGGSNAGHTVVLDDGVYKLHLIPSGILRENVVSVIGNGVVVDPIKVCAEVAGLIEQGISMEPDRFMISDRAHLVMPWHKMLDGIHETSRGKENLGTTKQGIGPCYSQKAQRSGLRGHHLADLSGFEKLVRERLRAANHLIEAYGGEPLKEDAVLPDVFQAAKSLQPFITDTVGYLHAALDRKASILLEGAQGGMLDLDFGTYPFVTSSNTTLGGCVTGSGIPATAIEEVHGVIKAFTTRVGTGPFPTELEDASADLLRGTGKNQWDEFGTTTGRPRRCGWLDLMVGRYSSLVSGVTHLHVTKLDVLSQFESLKVCTGYTSGAATVPSYPASLDALATCEAVYEDLPGWNCALHTCGTLAGLPEAARGYVNCIAKHLRAEIASISFGPARSQTVSA